MDTINTQPQPLTFKVGRNTYTIDKGDKFMDNFILIQFQPLDKYKIKTKRSGLMSWRPTITPKAKDWKALLETGRFEKIEFKTKEGKVQYVIYKFKG